MAVRIRYDVDFIVLGMSDEECSDFWSDYFHALHKGYEVKNIKL